MLSAELQQKMANWRVKAAAGTLSREEMREAILALRGSRRAAATEATRSKKAPAKSTDEMLNELDNL